MLPLHGEYLLKKKKKDPSYRPSFQAKPISTKIDLTDLFVCLFVSLHTVIYLWSSIAKLCCGFVTLTLDSEHLRQRRGIEEHVGFCA